MHIEIIHWKNEICKVEFYIFHLIQVKFSETLHKSLNNVYKYKYKLRTFDFLAQKNLQFKFLWVNSSEATFYYIGLLSTWLFNSLFWQIPCKGINTLFPGVTDVFVWVCEPSLFYNE